MTESTPKQPSYWLTSGGRTFLTIWIGQFISLIGSGLGVQNPVGIRLIVEQARVPVIVDAGVGTASDAAIAMELGVDGVLMNTAIAEAKDPIRMAKAMKHAVIAGREAYLAGRMGKKKYADPSSPLAGLI